MRTATRLLPALAVVVSTAVLASSCGDGKEAARAVIEPAPVPDALRSRPDLQPPPVAVDVAPGSPGEELIFVSPRMENRARDAETHQQGGLVVDQRGRTVWFRPAPDGEPMTDVQVQRYRGQPVLTWWEGAASELGIGRGKGVIVDTNYETVAEVQAGNGKTLDLHEMRLTPRGTALLTIYSRTRRDLSSLGGAKNAQVTQGVVQEVDVESGRVLLEWESIDEIAPSESIRPLPEEKDASFDYFHINSVAEDTDGNLLVSARHTSAVYKVDRRTGKLLWRLGGKKSDFELGPGVEFGLQHDVKRAPDGTLRIFDNGDEPKKGERPPVSSVKNIRLDMRRMRATLARRLRQPDGMYAQSQGNADGGADGLLAVGWGSTGAFSLFDGRRLIFDAHLPAQYDSYRAYVSEWNARPRRRPAISARREGGQITAWASWNGATEVDRWQLLAGPSPDALQPVGAPSRWSGLETTLVRGTRASFVAVAALDASGRRLATSEATRP